MLMGMLTSALATLNLGGLMDAVKVATPQNAQESQNFALYMIAFVAIIFAAHVVQRPSK